VSEKKFEKTNGLELDSIDSGRWAKKHVGEEGGIVRPLPQVEKKVERGKGERWVKSTHSKGMDDAVQMMSIKIPRRKV